MGVQRAGAGRGHVRGALSQTRPTETAGRFVLVPRLQPGNAIVFEASASFNVATKRRQSLSDNLIPRLEPGNEDAKRDSENFAAEPGQCPPEGAAFIQLAFNPDATAMGFYGEFAEG